MYQHRIEDFGGFDKHIFYNAATNNGFEVLPACEALLLNATFEGINIIEGYVNEEDLSHLKWGKSLVLYPFPNRLRDGKYTFEGKNYQFPINNAATGNAIHGLGRGKKHEVSSIVTAQNYASITCTYYYEGQDAAYPFPFRFDIEFFISDGNNMEVTMSFLNEGNGNLPVGIGWHPYFKIADKVDEVAMQLEGVKLIEIDERMLPTGKKTAYTDFEQLKEIGTTTLDNGFYINPNLTAFGVTLQSKKGSLRYWQEIGEGRYNFIQIFTPPHRESIALEPMTCNIDAFNNGDGLKILAPQETLKGSFGFSFKKAN
jgi:aldose 1-epimerase